MIPEAAVEAAVAALPSDAFFHIDREDVARLLAAAAPHMLAEDPRMDAIAAWCGRHRSGYYDEAQDDVMAIIRPAK